MSEQTSGAMKVGVIGTGHVGVVTCVTLAEFGHDVIGVDADEEKVARLQEGKDPSSDSQAEEEMDGGQPPDATGMAEEREEAAETPHGCPQRNHAR